jgi:hypothetical protein
MTVQNFTPATARENEFATYAMRLHLNGTFRSRGLNVKSPDALEPTPSNWTKLHTQLLADSASKDFNTLMNNMTKNATNYNTAVTAFRSLITPLNTVLGKTSARIVVCLPDGTVYFDSKNATDGDATNPLSNEYTNAKTDKSINENHNSRPCIMNAQLVEDGVSFESKYSSSTGNYEDYVAVRIGAQGASAGTVRYSV